MPCIKPIITCHLEMLFRYMLDKQGNEVQYRDSSFNIGIILVSVIMESHIFPIIGIDSGRGNDWPPKVAANVFDDSIGVTEIGFGIDVETILILFVNSGLSLFERRADMPFQFIKECSLESLAQVSVVEMLYNFPETVIRKAAFGKKAVNMRIPFQGSAEGVQDADKAWDEVSALIHLVEKPEDDTADSLEEAVEQGTVIQEERTQVFINGEDDMPVSTAEEFKGHFSGAFNAVLIATGRAEFGMAAKGDEFKFATVSTAKHGATERGIPTINHFFDVFHDNGTGMKDILYFFIVFFKNLLK